VPELTCLFDLEESASVTENGKGIACHIALIIYSKHRYQEDENRSAIDRHSSAVDVNIILLMIPDAY